MPRGRSASSVNAASVSAPRPSHNGPRSTSSPAALAPRAGTRDPRRRAPQIGGREGTARSQERELCALETRDLHFARREQIRDETMASRTRERSRHGLARHLFPAPFSTSHGQRPLYFTQGASRATPSSNLSPPRRPQHKENTRRSVVIRTHCLPSVCTAGRREGLASSRAFLFTRRQNR